MGFQEFIHEIDEENHDSFMKNDLSILHFFSDWEMDCLMVLPVIESLAEEFSGKISFGKVNIEEAENELISNSYEVYLQKRLSLED